MKLSEFAHTILLGESLENKLIDEKITFDDFELFTTPKEPARIDKLKFSNKNVKFPKGHFHLDDKKAMAIHSFANHELLAIEMMACALLIYPHNTDELKKFKLGVISALKDEQKHFKLYVQRLNELGYEFGDFAVNDFFWKQMSSLQTPAQYLAVMSLTFEAANLDFAYFYKNEFEKVDDYKTGKILAEVLKDEISHVAFGGTFLNRWKKDADLIKFYHDSLPGNLTPARGKGQVFVAHLREQAKLPADFVSWMQNYQDDFAITQRKEWK